MPYLFNGKERDEETGLLCFGARYYDSKIGQWYGVDLIRDKKPHIGGYVFCSANPIRMIDIDGMADKPWTNISPVISKDKFIGWGRNPFYRSFIDRQLNNGVSPDKVKAPACADYAREQLRVAGYSTGGGDTKSNMYPYNEKTGVNREETQKAIDYIQEQLTNGIPVFVGVDDAYNQKINEGTTDHFVVIVGMGNDDKGNYFSFYDNASGNTAQGTNPENKLYYDEATQQVTGKSQTDYGQNPKLHDYILSQVRETRRNKNSSNTNNTNNANQ